MKTITPDMALSELAQREIAQREFMSYCTYVAPWYEPAKHHEIVAFYLEQVEQYVETEGKEGIGRLIILEPPRYGKTEEAARLFPSWFLGKLPDKRVIITSYGADLAEEDSKSVRNFVLDYRYEAVFGKNSILVDPVALSDDSRSKANWDLAAPHRGGVVAAGIGGGITGKGAHLLIIDDPFKSREDADSEPYRKRVMSWYRSVAYQRLEKGGAIVIMHTRWHPDDLVGQLLKIMASDDPLADQWTVVFLPAVALQENEYPTTEEQFKENLLKGIYIPMGGDLMKRAPGTPLWPEKFSIEDLERKKANTDDDEWMSLDQQMPLSASGELFSEEMIGDCAIIPGKVQWFCYIDLALGKNQLSDMNAAMIEGIDETSGDLICRDLIHVRNLDEFLGQVKAAMLDPIYKGTIWGVESSGFQYVEFQKFIKDKELVGVSIVERYPDGDKVRRARPVVTRARSGHFKFVTGSWNQKAKRQLVAFPKATHDDIVDTISGGLEMISDGASGLVKALKVSPNPFYKN